MGSYFNPLFLYVDSPKTIYVRVLAYYNSGTYAVRYYDSANSPPHFAPANVQWIPQPDYTITWDPVYGATGYTVSRSITEMGPYNTTWLVAGESNTSFTDTGTSSGTYWYKVKAVNGNGDGPDSAPVAAPLPLTSNTWKEGELTTYWQTDWYSFSATGGVTYNLQLDSLYDGTGGYTGEVAVMAFKGSDGSFLNSSAGYVSPMILSVPVNDTIYVKLEAYNPGTYRIRYYDPANSPPYIAPAYVQMLLPQPYYTFRWDSVEGATGYQVSRSENKEGPYTDRGSPVSDDGNYSYDFTDIGVSSGTYWYRVRAINGNGHGPDSAPVAAPLPLTFNTWKEGEFTMYWQTDWYSFSAEAGVTYNLQFDSLYNGPGGYTGDVHVEAYSSDGSFLGGNSMGYFSPITLNVTANDTINVMVGANNPGTYAIRYYQ
jgi:hypothetical protein